MDDKALNNRIEPNHKLRLFVDIFRAFAGEDRYDVNKKILIDELINTSKFTEEEAEAYFKRAQQDGFIFERNTDVYALA